MRKLIAYKILMNAAKLVDKGRREYVNDTGIDTSKSWVQCGCDAISEASIGSSWEDFIEAEEAFQTMEPSVHTSVYDYWWGNPHTCSNEDHNARILGLLFAAEMVK